MKGGHECVVYDRDRQIVDELVKGGATRARSLEDVVQKLTAPRAIWVMLPSGKPTEETIVALFALLGAGDTIIDGGNSFFTDDIRRSEMCAPKDVCYIDVGRSGGVWGLERGYCMMIGGNQSAVERLNPIFATLAPGPGDISKTPGSGERKSRAERGYLIAVCRARGTS